jgi:hypothetical protein
MAIDNTDHQPYTVPTSLMVLHKNGVEVNVIGAGTLVAMVMLVGLVVLVVALVDLVKRPAGVWAASGHNQLVWAVIVVFVAFIGPLLYLVIARPALENGVEPA